MKRAVFLAGYVVLCAVWTVELCKAADCASAAEPSQADGGIGELWPLLW